MSFEGQLKAYAKKTKSSLEQAERAIVLAVFNGVISDTRVDTGRARGNWQTTTGQSANGTLERNDPSGAQAMADAAASVKPGQMNYLTNNLPYIGKLEDADAMVDKNMARIERIVSEVARSVDN